MSTSTFSAIVARVKTQLEAIANIGLVHDRQRFVLNDSSLDTIAVSSIGGENRYRLWQLSLERMRTQAADASGRMEWRRVLVVDGWLQIEDANSSELTAVGLAESVVRALWADGRSTKYNGTVLDARVPMLEYVRPEFHGPIPCHHVRITQELYTIEDAP